MEDQSSLIQTGNRLDNITFTFTDGTKQKVSDLAQPWLLINLFTTGCPFCRRALRYLQQEIQPLFGSRLNILVVGRDNSREELETFLQRKKIPFPFVPDKERNIYHQFAHRYVPRFYLVNQERVVVWQVHGFDPDEPAGLKECLIKYIR